MTKEEMKSYAERYRRVQKKLSIGVSIFIFIISAILIAGAIIIAIYANSNYYLWFAVGVMSILAVVDIFVAIRFIKYSRVKFDKMSDKECAEHYCKIHGFDSRVK